MLILGQFSPKLCWIDLTLCTCVVDAIFHNLVFFLYLSAPSIKCCYGDWSLARAGDSRWRLLCTSHDQISRNFFLFVFLRASVTAVVYSSLEKSLSSVCIGRLSCSCLSTLLHSSEVATGGLSEKALILEENKEINIFSTLYQQRIKQM